MSDSQQQQQDLDAFLTSLESKLRGPFSCLELAKSAQSAARSDSTSATQYLTNVKDTLAKADKVTQLRVLVGLLGIDPDSNDDGSGHDEEDTTPSSDAIIDSILLQAQEAPLYEEWVRIIASLVRGIMYEDISPDDVDDDGNGSKSPSEGEKQLDKTCSDILKQIKKLEKETNYESDEDGDDPDSGYVPSRLEKADACPLFAPYRYALLNRDLLKRSIPEALADHAHFKVDQSASILHIDSELEHAKAMEEEEHGKNLDIASQKSSSSGAASKSGAAANRGAATPAFPGFRSGKNNNSSGNASTAAKGSAMAAARKRQLQQQQQQQKTSMFMPSRKPGQGSTAAAAMKAKAKGLHTRRAGAAQALLSKGRKPKTSAATLAGGGGAAAAGGGARKLGAGGGGGLRGRAAVAQAKNKLGNQRSKMMMLDVSEVQGLSKSQQEREGSLKGNSRKSKLLSGSKRKASAPADHSTNTSVSPSTSRPNKRDREDATKPPPPPQQQVGAHEPRPQSPPEPSHDGVDADAAAGPASASASASPSMSASLASAALSAYQAQLAGKQQGQTESAAASGSTNNNNNAATKQQDWREMLREKSNRLSADDRFRIQQFFVDRFNPTPDQHTYKMKLHEARSTDPKTGVPVKETYYLELDYTNFTSKQSKKTKRYAKDGH